MVDRSTEELTRAFGEIDAALVVAGHPLQADVQHDGGTWPSCAVPPPLTCFRGSITW